MSLSPSGRLRRAAFPYCNWVKVVVSSLSFPSLRSAVQLAIVGFQRIKCFHFVKGQDTLQQKNGP